MVAPIKLGSDGSTTLLKTSRAAIIENGFLLIAETRETAVLTACSSRVVDGMFMPTSKSSLAVLLVIGMVISAVTPVYRHAHPLKSIAGHGHEHGVEDVTDDDSAHDDFAGAVDHVHICVLGVDYSVPQDDPSDHPISDSTGRAKVFLSLLSDLAPLACGSMRADIAVTPALPATNLFVTRFAEPNLYWAHAQPAAPLCDVARHDRSGVLVV